MDVGPDPPARPRIDSLAVAPHTMTLPQVGARLAARARVSIGLPVYNGAETLAVALESLLRQTYSDFDLLICDNASSDATPAIAEAACARDSRVRYLRHADNIGAVANFEFAMDHADGEFFMWAAADDIRDPSWLSKAVDALDRQPRAVLAASDIGMCHDINEYAQGTAAVSFHELTSGIAADRPHVRYRTIVRHGGWSATYGLIRRAALERTRKLASMTFLPALGVAADYRLIELCLMGPFAYLAEPLLINQVRLRAQDDLTDYLLPSRSERPPVKSSFLWQFADTYKLGKLFKLPLGDRIVLQFEYLRSLRAPGTLHVHMVERNVEAYLQAKSRWQKLALTLELNLALAPDRRSLLQQNRTTTRAHALCQAELVDRTRRLEKHIRDYGPET